MSILYKTTRLADTFTGDKNTKIYWLSTKGLASGKSLTFWRRIRTNITNS